MGKATWKIAIVENFIEQVTVEADTEEEAVEEALNKSSFVDPDIFEILEATPTTKPNKRSK